MSLLRNVSVPAIAIGLVTNMVTNIGTNLALYLLMVSHGIPMNQIMPRMHSVSGLMLSSLYGIGFTVLSGYLAGRIAKRSPVVHGAVVGTASVLLSLLCWEPGNPHWYVILYYGSMVPAAMLGGYCAGRSAARRVAVK